MINYETSQKALAQADQSDRDGQAGWAPPRDLNLLSALNALLQEHSVAGAARRLRLSPSAVSRQLQRLREATGDPLLVRSGRGLVPTPRALELRDQVAELLEGCEGVLRPLRQQALMSARGDFTLRVSQAIMAKAAVELVRRMALEVPGVRPRFMLKQQNNAPGLSDGSVDLEIASVKETKDQDLRSLAVFRDSFVGLCRMGHAGLDFGAGSAPDQAPAMPLQAYAAFAHVDVARHTPGPDQPNTPIDRSLAKLGLSRRIAVVVDDFSSAIEIASATDLIATIPSSSAAKLPAGLVRFDLPMESPQIQLSMLWHPRSEADPVHRWVRTTLRALLWEAPRA